MKRHVACRLPGNWTHDLCDAGAVLYQLSYQANWELVMLWLLAFFTVTVFAEWPGLWVEARLKLTLFLIETSSLFIWKSIDSGDGKRRLVVVYQDDKFLFNLLLYGKLYAVYWDNRNCQIKILTRGHEHDLMGPLQLRWNLAGRVLRRWGMETSDWFLKRELNRLCGHSRHSSADVLSVSPSSERIQSD